jgi:hypothetical protein
MSPAGVGRREEPAALADWVQPLGLDVAFRQPPGVPPAGASSPPAPARNASKSTRSAARRATTAGQVGTTAPRSMLTSCRALSPTAFARSAWPIPASSLSCFSRRPNAAAPSQVDNVAPQGRRRPHRFPAALPAPRGGGSINLLSSRFARRPGRASPGDDRWKWIRDRGWASGSGPVLPTLQECNIGGKGEAVTARGRAVRRRRAARPR